MKRVDVWMLEREKAQRAECGLLVLKGKTLSGDPCLTVWKPKATNPYINYRFRTEEAREDYLAKAIESFQSYQARIAFRREERKPSPEVLDQVKVGDIFVWTWGYDQTNVDFFQVTRKNGAMVELREIGSSTVAGSEGFMCDSREAVKDCFLSEGKRIIKRLNVTPEGRPYVAMKFGWCSLWDGKKVGCSWYA